MTLQELKEAVDFALENGAPKESIVVTKQVGREPRGAKAANYQKWHEDDRERHLFFIRETA